MDGRDDSRDDRVVDLTDDPASVDLRAEVADMVAEVQAATRHVAPLLRDATTLLAQVDRMVSDFAAVDGPGDYIERLARASQASGHDQLFDALQSLSLLADAYMAVADGHQFEPVAASAATGADERR